MRTTRDALLSVKRYTAEILGSDWEVRLWADRGQFRLPGALVLRVGGTQSSGPKFWSDLMQPVAIHCYIKPPETVEQALLNAHDVEEMVTYAIDVDGVGEGHKRRIPLYDFDGVDPLVQDSDKRYAHDYLRVVDFSSQLMPDVEDPRQIRIVFDLRVGWRRTGVLPHGDPVEGIQITGEVA